MKRSKAFALFLLSSILVFGTAAQSDCDSKKNKNAAANNQANQIAMNSQTNQAAANNTNSVKTPPPGAGNVKTLAEGANSPVKRPFLFVVRSAETYRQLQSAIDNLPADAGVDFDKQAIVAAFAGERMTGGFSVEIKQTGAGVAVSIAAPPADAMVTQALTQPFKIAAVAVETENALNLQVSGDFERSAQVYKLTAGDFEYSGGLAGRMKKFAAEGTIEVWQFGDLVTLEFDLSGTGADKNMRLAETASGIVKNEKIELARLDAGSFSEGPKPPVKISGTMTSEKLSLTFEPLPTTVNDGFELRGKLEAVKSK